MTIPSIPPPAPLLNAKACPLPAKLKIAGWSMFPTFHKGDYLVLSEPKKIELGNAVIYEENGRWICHRVKGFKAELNSWVIAPEEASPEHGSVILSSQIIGKVDYAVRRGKKIPAEPRVKFIESEAAPESREEDRNENPFRRFYPDFWDFKIIYPLSRSTKF
jgi:hypothetical protein